MIGPAKVDTQIIIAGGDEGVRRRIDSAVAGLRARVSVARGIDDVIRLARDTAGVGVLVLARDTGREIPAPALAREIRFKCPLLHILVAYADAKPTRVHVPYPERAGIDGWLLMSNPADDHLIGGEVASRLKFPLPRECAALIRSDASQTAEIAATWCVRNAYRPISIDRLARHFGWDRTTIARHVRRSFTLRLEDVVDWARCGDFIQIL
jgi:hypothetical protein